MWPLIQHSEQAQDLTTRAEFSCARCWKQKKKCDKVTPKCGRCTSLKSECVYSPQPPKNSVFSLERPKETQIRLALLKEAKPAFPDQTEASQFISNTTILSTSSDSKHSPPEEFNQNGLDASLTSQVSAIFAADGNEIESSCRLYFETFHIWIPFLSEVEFWQRYFRNEITSNPEFSLLVLSIYLISYTPKDHDHKSNSIESVYSTAKSVWALLRDNTQPSILLIQAGLLLANYENGQSLEREGSSTVRACVKMGCDIELHRTLRQDTTATSCGQAELRTRRRLWWGIVIFERLLSIRNLERGCSYASQHPTLDDYLSQDQDTSSTNLEASKVLGEYKNSANSLSNVAFDPANPYGTLIQATYLLSRVSDYISSNMSSPGAQETEAENIDNALQEFARSLLLQAQGKKLVGEYCTSFFTTMMCLVIFHSHLLRRSGLSESSCTQSPSRPLIAIQALTRMFQANGSKMSSVQAQVYQQPPFLAHMVYLGLVLHVKVGRVGDDKEWDAYFEHLVGILTILKRKWKLAGVYLDDAMSMLRDIRLSGPF